MINTVKHSVVLLAHTNNLRLPAKAARFCTSSKPIEDIMKPQESDQRILETVLEAGHTSVLEHINFSFGISGISRVTEVQFVRHRIASFSVKSGRYTTSGDTLDVIIPESLEGWNTKIDSDVWMTTNELINACHKVYHNLLSYGVSPEDARYILPQGIATQFIVTMNARELLKFFSLRCCGHAQWEIRNVAWDMLRICKNIQPTIFENAGPKCLEFGTCRESKKHHCGYRPHVSDSVVS